LKSQTPNPKLQKGSKSQAPKMQILDYPASFRQQFTQTIPEVKRRGLVFDAWDFFRAWELVLGAFFGVWSLGFGAFLS